MVQEHTPPRHRTETSVHHPAPFSLLLPLLKMSFAHESMVASVFVRPAVMPTHWSFCRLLRSLWVFPACCSWSTRSCRLLVKVLLSSVSILRHRVRSYLHGPISLCVRYLNVRNGAIFGLIID
ncbi:hypothetical protein CKAH01_15082 [Colletotrichum kahawae]|uniref:Uncharacterized protein n=1 Tax=Colletotrichum kahawae TaxID=34407 RepID=A0AAD9YKB5_COLKA|nr:hypothetical protein CKAH01_15082 [Colletotrichum kahawae]